MIPLAKPARKIISFVENPQTPFLYYILLFFSSVTLRNFLETFSDRAKISFQLFPAQEFIYFLTWLSLAISSLHYYLFWLALLLALGIIFYAFTKEKINKILRTVLTFSFIINMTPLVDLIASQGKGLNISYVYPKSISTFLPLPNTLTPGMRLTVIAAVILSFIYGKIKSNDLTKGLWTGFTFYVLLLLASILPFLLGVTHPVPLIRLFLILIFIELGAIFYLYRKDYFLALFRDARLTRAMHFVLMFILGIFLTKEPFLKVISQNLDSFLLTLVSIFFAWIAAVMFNNLEDYDIDRISNIDRPLVLGTIRREDYRKMALFVVALAAIFGLGVNLQTSFFMLLFMGNSFLYSLPPLKIKRIPIFSKLPISLDSLILVILGYIFAGGELLGFPSGLTWYFLVFLTLALNFIDLKDYAGDKQVGIVTLPVMLGLKRAKLVIGGLFLLTYCLLSWVLLDLRLFIPSLALGGLQFFLINKKVYQEKWVLVTYLVGLLCLLFYLALIK